ncbi:hypothetical protein C4B68_02500 [Streptomyces dengpaensis]|uniref:Membrane transport protein MMPL domain-containing protein n=1 Tax=Streptomyces dengpaensis TaxID=2049881 RepID=A0ABN5ICR6_9ACTN|nr:hypothetical protein C4B68_02500 [Streptomyces dengpaensis]
MRRPQRAAAGGGTAARPAAGGQNAPTGTWAGRSTAPGLGLGIDYGLLVVSRFREEIAAGHAPSPAAMRTVHIADHTIVFRAATVCAVVATGATAALTVLPALLALLGGRVNAWPFRGRRRTRVGAASCWWQALPRQVVRRPLLAALPVTGLLAVCAAPLTTPPPIAASPVGRS